MVWWRAYRNLKILTKTWNTHLTDKIMISYCTDDAFACKGKWFLKQCYKVAVKVQLQHPPFSFSIFGNSWLTGNVPLNVSTRDLLSMEIRWKHWSPINAIFVKMQHCVPTVRNRLEKTIKIPQRKEVKKY